MCMAKVHFSQLRKKNSLYKKFGCNFCAKRLLYCVFRTEKKTCVCHHTNFCIVFKIISFKKAASTSWNMKLCLYKLKQVVTLKLIKIWFLQNNPIKTFSVFKLEPKERLKLGWITQVTVIVLLHVQKDVQGESTENILNQHLASLFYMFRIEYEKT